MLSLLTFAAVVLLALLSTGWALALIAKQLGSPKGNVRTGLLAALLGFLANALILALLAAIPLKPLPALVTELGLTAGTSYLVLLLFRLSPGRTLTLVGVRFAVGLAWVALMMSVIRPNVFEAYSIPADSMAPTLVTHDRITVAKRVTPRRLDVAAFYAARPNRPILCQRIVALPGERLRFSGGNLYINDTLLPLPPLLAGKCHATPPDGSAYLYRYRDDQTITLGPAEYFILGDNLDHAIDSRIMGPISASDLVGTVDLVYWPPTHARILR